MPPKRVAKGGGNGRGGSGRGRGGGRGGKASGMAKSTDGGASNPLPSPNEENSEIDSSNKVAKPTGSENNPGTPPSIPKRNRVEDKETNTEDHETLAKCLKLSTTLYRSRRQIRTSEKLASAGWEDTNNFPKECCCNDTVDVSRLPSPLATWGDQEDKFVHIINNHTSAKVRDLFRYFATSRNQFKRTLEKAFEDGCLASFHEYEPEGQKSPGPGTSPHEKGDLTAKPDEPEIKVCLFPRNIPQLSVRFEPSNPGHQVNKEILDVRRCLNRNTGEVGFFIINVQLDFLVINESIFGKRLIVGPLPDFAIIQIEGQALIWCGTPAGIDYVPNPDPQISCGYIDSKARTDSRSQIATEEEDGMEDSPADQTTWEEILEDGLERYRTQRRESQSRVENMNPKPRNESSLNPHQINRYWDMDHEGVILAIASIWEAFRDQAALEQEDIRYAFAGLDVFDPHLFASGLMPGSGVVGGMSRFIIPLIFPVTQDALVKHFNESTNTGKGKAKGKDKGKSKSEENLEGSPPIGHILLAVAKQVPGDTNNIRIHIRDSRPGTEREDSIRQTVRQLVTNSGWAGRDAAGNPIRPRDKWNKPIVPSVESIRVPRQPELTNSCGLFTILNAWAVMLEIPIRGSGECSGAREDTETMEMGLEIVNLALAGFMNSTTIQAFMNVFGLSDPQNPKDPEDNVILHVDAVSMNIERLRVRLDHQRTRDQLGVVLPLSPSPEIEGDSNPGTVSPELQQVLDAAPNGTTRQHADLVLRSCEGNPEDAINLLWIERQLSPSPGTSDRAKGS